MLCLFHVPRLRPILSRTSARCLATVRGDAFAPPQSADADGSSPQVDANGLNQEHRIAVNPNHGLWHFFRKKEVSGVVRYETVEPPDVKVTGRSWTAAELRRKSFSDLHTLWYVLLRERNLLATQREEARRLGVTEPRAYTSVSKIFQCRKTMARIKGVLNERRLAYEGAVNIVEQQRAEAEAEENAKVVRSEDESNAAKKAKERETVLEKMRRADGYQRRKMIRAGTDSRQARTQPQSGDGRPSPAISVASNLFPSDPLPRPS